MRPRRTIAAAGLDRMLERLLEQGQRLVAPARRGRRLVFDQVATVGEICRDGGNTDLPPKELLFPRSEPVNQIRMQLRRWLRSSYRSSSWASASRCRRA